MWYGCSGGVCLEKHANTSAMTKKVTVEHISKQVLKEIREPDEVDLLVTYTAQVVKATDLKSNRVLLI